MPTNRTLGKILVVDDEPELKAALVDVLSSQGFEARGFSSGADALQILRDENFDLLLTDLMMPEMDGITLLQRALEIDPNLVPLIMTGQGTIQTAVDAMKVGAFDYVLKPFRIHSLMPVLTRAMNMRHLRLENVQLREAVAIHELSQTIAFTLDPQTVLSKLADTALQQSEADEVSVLLPTTDRSELYVAAVRGAKRERLLGERIPFDQSISSWVGRKLTPVILNGEVHDDRFVALWPRPDIRSSVSVPMQVANKLVGVLNVNIVDRPRPFTLGQMKGLGILAGTAAAALESASLYSQVQAAEKNYRSIFENAVEGIFQSTPDQRFITVNPALAHILGYESPEEVVASFRNIGKQLYVDPALPPQVTRALEERGVLRGFEFEAFRKDGSKIWLSLNIRVVCDETGAELCREGTIEDITERKRVEDRQGRRSVHALFRAEVSAALAMSRAPLRAPLETCATAMVQHLGAAFARIWTLNSGEDVLELQASAGIYTHIDGPHSRVPVGSFKIGKIAQERTPHITNKVQSDPRVGDKEWARREGMVAFAGYPLLLENKLLGVMAMFSRGELAEDTLDALASVADLISQGIERKRAEEALRESEERYRDLVENARDIIYEHDLEGHYTSTNKAGEQITGYSLAETLDLNLSQMVAPEYLEKARGMFRRKLAGEKITAYELEILTKQGKRVAVEVNTRLVYHDGTPVGVQGIARDVTERKQLEEQLRQSQKLEAIGQLAGGVAHDFNNLLTVIGGYSSLLLGKLAPDSPYRTGVEEIKKAGDRAGDLTRQLLAFSRKQILQPKVLDLNTVVTDLHKMVRRLIGEDIDLVTVTAPGLGKVKADPGQVEQVLLNLIVNARDAMPQGGQLTIETRNFVLSQKYADRHAIQPGPYVLLAVSDTGCGMDATIQARIFEPFFTTKGATKGTGLGLATVYGIVKQSGGNIWVYSEPGKGTTFKVYLPRVDAPAETEEVSGERPLPEGTETILLVEDEDQVRAILQQILEGQGYSVLSASNGEDGLAIARERDRDIKLMITDVVMPQMSGRELADKVLAIRPGLPVLFMSGYTDDAIVRHGLLNEKINFIQKPFESALVARKVREVLDAPV